MAKTSPNSITSMEQSWKYDTENGLPFSGDAVEAFIKKTFGGKVGYTKVVTGSDGTSNVMAGFATQDDYFAWMELPEEARWGEAGAAYLITSATLPSIWQGDTYTVGLTLRETPGTIQPSAAVVIAVKGTSTVTYAAGATDNVQEDLNIIVQTRTSSTAEWVTKGTLSVAANGSDYTEIYLAPFLSSGTNHVRIRAVGEHASSIWRSFTLTVVALSLTPNTAFAVPMTGSTLLLNYLVGGAVAKTLQFEFGTGIGSGFTAQYSYLNGDPGCSRNIGTVTNLTTGISCSFDDAAMMAVLMADGVHTVRARLYVSETVRTEWVESQYMVANGASVAPAVIVNNVNPVLANWTDVSFFRWAANTPMTVRFRLVDSADSSVQYAAWTQQAQTNVEYELATQLGIETADPDAAAFYAYMHIEDTEGNALASPVFFTFSNSSAFSPTSGADLVIQPADRSNSEADPQTVINKVTGLAVPSVWEGFGMVSDGWMDVNRDVDSTAADAETVRALRIPAGRRLTIGYNPFAEFMDGNNTGRHVTVEMDFRTNNILDDAEAVVKMCSIYPTDQRAWGFEMLPQEAYMLTQRRRAVDDQNVTWAEGVRTHLVLNIVYGLQGLNYARIFINGRCEREFNYPSNDVFVGETVSMVLGNDHSDLDVFGIRVYKKALSTEEVMQDYKASLSTVAEKIAFADMNDILGDDGAISWTKAKEKYNVIGLTGHLAKYGDENKGKTSGNKLEIHKPNDPAHSGILTELENSGQGTTAMTYYDWNQQQKVSEGSQFIPETDPENPVSASGGFSPAAGEPKAKKMCGKINFASSMQGHKMGLTRVYTEVFRRLVSMGVMSEPHQMALQPSARIAVYQEPYLFFHRETESDPYVFRYLMTWGAGKGDKPTFGYSGSGTPGMLMVEGANNDRHLALFRIPWNDDVSYSPADEAWMYNGQKQLNFGFGHTAKNQSNEEYPDHAGALASMRAFFNFVYLHHQRVRYFAGTLSQLRGSAVADRRYFYWVTQADTAQGSSQYDVYRYDDQTANWVDAGVEKSGAGSYAKLNLRTQYVDFGGAAAWTPGQWEAINAMAVAQRTAHFKTHASEYMHVDDCLYHSCIVKLSAGTDNRAKNTYYYTDAGDLKIRHEQDDLDTILKTNNVGQNRKPYYVEEHDTNASGEFYWQGEESGYYNLLETAFEDEMAAMMNNIFTAMASIGGSVTDYLVSRMLEAQDYFPAVAYNEQARLVYETAAVAQAAGDYVNTSVQAITQSCGTQRWSEYDWLRNRVMYLSSWCEYGEFAGSSSAANGLSWRGKNGAVYNFRLKTARWLYPRVGSDSGNYPPSASGRRVRVPAGQTIDYPAITLSSDSWISIRGINYYVDIGDMNVGVSADQGAFVFYGKLLQKIEVNPDGAGPNLLLASSISIANATNIKSIALRNVDTAVGEIDLSKCARLESIDLRGSTFPLVELPASERLAAVRFPATLTDLRIDAQPNLETVQMEGVDYLNTIHVDQAKAGSFDTGLLAVDIYNSKIASGGVITSARFYNVNWTNVRADMLMYYANSSSCEMSGSIAMLAAANDRYLRFPELQVLIDRFGDIQSAGNGLYIDYPKRTITSFGVSGEKYVKSTGQFGGWQLKMLPGTGNNVAIVNGREAVNWSFVGSNAAQAANYAVFTDTVRGVLNVTQLSDPAIELRFTVRVTMTLVGGGTLTFDKRVGFYNRIPKLGDFAYSDGSFDDEYDKVKTLAGAVTKVSKVNDEEYDCEVCAKEDVSVISTDGALVLNTLPWGLYPDNGNNGFPGTVMQEIVNATGLASAYNTAIPDASVTGIPNADGTSHNYNTVNDSFLDAGKEDGYADLLATGAAARFDGEGETSIVIAHASAVILHYLSGLYPDVEDIRVPTTLTELADALAAIVAQNAGATNPNRYRQFFFPAAFACHLYQPEMPDGEELHEQYRRFNWHLPALGTLARLYNFYLNSCGRNTSASVSEIYANENAESEAVTPLLANLVLRVKRITEVLPFAMPLKQNYLSSTERDNIQVWGIQFAYGILGVTYRYSHNNIRPFVNFRYHL